MEYFLYDLEKFQRKKKFFQRKINCKVYRERCELYVPLFAKVGWTIIE